MARKIGIDRLASEITKALDEYSSASEKDVRKAVKKTGEAVKRQIQNTAPKKTGEYAKSWATKEVETGHGIKVVVHSRNRYQIAHLLEFGHAKRGGGRVAARPHIAPAENACIRMLENEIGRCLKNG